MLTKYTYIYNIAIYLNYEITDTKSSSSDKFIDILNDKMDYMLRRFFDKNLRSIDENTHNLIGEDEDFNNVPNSIMTFDPYDYSKENVHEILPKQK